MHLIPLVGAVGWRHTLTALGFIMSVLPISRCEHHDVQATQRCWWLPCLMTLLLHPALSSCSVRREETLNLCNGLKWSKFHPPQLLHLFLIQAPFITCCLISWCTDKGRGRFHGEGTHVVLVCQSVHFTAIILSHSTHSAAEIGGRTFRLIAFKWK